MLSGNKGEWSEVYVHLKLLADGVLYAADADLNLLKSLYFPIIKIIRRQDDQKFEYLRNGDIVVVDSGTQTELLRFPIRTFIENAKLLFKKITSAEGRSFRVPEIENLLEELKIRTLSARSSDKSDITIKVHDHRTGYDPELGFSIKSMLGSASTLFNAGYTTNFVFEIIDLPVGLVDKINTIEERPKIKNRIDYIEQNGGQFRFVKIDSETLNLNLILIDSLLPEILAHLLYYYYSQKVSAQLSDLILSLNTINPLNFNLDYDHPLYSHKVKNFLTDVALGMTPATVWNGVYDATGGIIFVKSTGEILCYHIYNRSEFQEYLLKNTRLEQASMTRYNFGVVYEEDGRYFIKLNLQIRFI